MRKFAIALAIFSVTFLYAPPAGGVGLPAGTRFQVVAQATYTDAVGTIYDSGPVSLTLTVEQVAGVSIEPGTDTGLATPGDDYYVPIRIINTGNGIDAFALTSSSSNGWNTAIVYDDNADGIHQPTEQTVISVAGLIVADGYSPCFARVSVPSNAKSDDTLRVGATSNFDPRKSSQVQLNVRVPKAPSVTITTPSAAESFTVTEPLLTLGGTASGGLSITRVEWRTNSGASGTCTGTTTWSTNAIRLALGANVITVTATDTAGRTASDTCTVTYSDPNPPTITITSPTTESTYTTNEPTIDISGTASDDVAVVSVTWSTSAGASGNCTGTNQWTATDIPLSIGTNTITFTAKDGAGNSSSVTISVVRDPTAPVVKVVRPGSTGRCTRNCPFVKLAGTVEDNGAIAQVTWSNQTTGESGTCDVNGTSWNSPSIPLALGENRINVAARDEAGNTGTDVIYVTYVDAMPGDDWRGLAMVSLPIIPDETDPKLEVGFSENYWLTYLPQSNTYATYPQRLTWLEPAEATPGRGFWAYFNASSASPRGTIPPQDKSATISLKKGWNLVGTPFINPVKWSLNNLKVRTSGGVVKSLRNATDLVAGYAWGWRQNASDPGTGSYYLVYDSSVMPGIDDQLLPWRAYWIKANCDCELIIPAP